MKLLLATNIERIVDYQGYEIHCEGFLQYSVYDDSGTQHGGTYLSLKDAKDAVDNMLLDNRSQLPQRDLSKTQIRTKGACEGNVYKYAGYASCSGNSLGYFDIVVQAKTYNAAISKIKSSICQRCNMPYTRLKFIAIDERCLKMI